MSDGFDITLDLKAPTGGLDDYLRKMKAIEARQKQINKLAGVSRGMTSGTTPTTDPTQHMITTLERTQRVQAQRVPTFTKGPAQRLQAAIRNQANAGAMGNQAQQFDAGIATQRARKAYEAAIKAASPETSDQTGKAFKTALLSVRGAAGKGGLSGEALGLAESFGPLGMAITGAVSAFELIKATAENASKSMGDFISAQAISGGTPTETALLNDYGAVAGRTPQQAASDAMAFSQEMAKSGWAMNFFQKFGIQPSFDPQGHINPDQTPAFKKALNAMMNQMTPDQLNQAFKDAPVLQNYANLPYMSPADKARINRDAAQDAATYGNPQNRAAATGFDVAKSRASTATKQVFGKAAEDALTPVFNAYANLARHPSVANTGIMAKVILPAIVNPLAPVLALEERAAKAIKDSFESQHPAAATAAKTAAAKTAAAAHHAGKSQSKTTSALDQNTQALNRLALAIPDTREFIGGGERTRGAVPARWRLQVMGQVQKNNWSRTLGAFSQ